MPTAKPEPLLPALLAELRDFIKARRGRANALSADLGAPQPTVSAWINGHREPGGEATLQLAAWLARAKAAEASEGAEIEAKAAEALKALSARSGAAPQN